MQICLMLENQQTQITLTSDPTTLLANAASLTLRQTDLKKLIDEAELDVEISVLLTDNEEIRTLNAAYRDKDCPTDVLSFPQEDDVTAVLAERDFLPGQPLSLGDIIISMERAQEQAEAYGHSLEREVSFLFVHGLLHLLGYDHMEEAEEQEMRALQTAILTELGQAR